MLPPGPSSGTLTMLKTLRDPYGVVVGLAKKYGDPFTVTLPLQGPIVVTGDPAVIKAIFSADPDQYASAAEGMAPLIGQNSILVLEGAAHRKARKLLAPPFHGSRMKSYGALMQARTVARSAHLREGARVVAQQLGEVVSLDVILRAVFGTPDGERMEKMNDAVRGWMGAMGPGIAGFPFLRHSFGGFGPWANFQRARQALRAQIDEAIEERKNNPCERDDILSLMLSARYDDGSAMSNEEVFDQLGTLVAAGHETSMISLAWAFYWLHRNPEALARLQAELDSLGPSPAPDALAQLPYLDAVIQETLRLYPVVAINTRKLAKPFSLAGHELPVGLFIGAAASMVHYREDLYPEPERFRPERFLERTFSASEYFPFGGGARRCLGAAFAVYELKIVLGTLLSRFRFRAADDKPVRPAMRAAGIGPGRSVEMVVIERR